MKLMEVELIETEWKTKRKYQKVGTHRLETTMLNLELVSGMVALKQICEQIDCNFCEVLDAINRTVR